MLDAPLSRVAEGASYGLAGLSAGINYFNGNTGGAFATAVSAAVGFVLPKDLWQTLPSLTGSTKAAGEFIAGAVGDLASQIAGSVVCHPQ